jgi:hypothetical protein
MTISVNNGVRSNSETTSSYRTINHGARGHGKKRSRVARISGKVKTGWIGAALLRGRGGISAPPIEGQH